MSDQLVSFSDLRDLFANMPPSPPDPGAKKLPNPFIQKYVKRSPPAPAPAPAAGKPSPPSRSDLIAGLGLASFPPDDLQVLLAIATDAGVVPPDTPSDDAATILADAVLPTKKNGEVYLDLSRAHVALAYLILRSNGMRTKEAVLASGLGSWVPIGIFRAHNKAYRAMYQAADERYLAAIGPHVVDSLVDAAVNGDTVRKMRDGEVVSEAHRANVRAQELVLKATDARFREPDKGGSAAAGGVTYNIGAINVAALPPASSAPALPAAGPAPETIEIGPDSCGFGADAPSVPRGNYA